MWTVLFGAVVLLNLLVLVPTALAGATTARTPPSWVAHSAYGIQVSIPKSWKVTYFLPCPEADTLNIGAASYMVDCPIDNVGSWIEIEPALLGISPPIGPYSFRVHRLQVTTQPGPGVRNWFVPSKALYLSGWGPKALAIMRTLTVAWRRAIPASGAVTGKVYLNALTQVPVTGSVSVTALKSHKTRTLDAFDGGWGAVLPSGHYAATSHDGDAVCAPVSFIVLSGLRVAAPTIQCQGL
jgi:hypothetical protein